MPTIAFVGVDAVRLRVANDASKWTHCRWASALPETGRRGMRVADRRASHLSSYAPGFARPTQIVCSERLPQISRSQPSSQSNPRAAPQCSAQRNAAARMVDVEQASALSTLLLGICTWRREATAASTSLCEP